MAKTRVLIADDHGLMRAGLRALVEAQADMEVAGEAADGVAVVEETRRRKPDVVLMDLSMPGRGGIAATQELRRAFPEVQVVAVTMHEDAAYARQALLAGATGYVLKKSLTTELLAAIRAARRGQRHVPRALAAKLANPIASAMGQRNRPEALQTLTPREREVIGLIALGHTTAEIAQRLSIAAKTVETHRANVADKLGLHTRADLVRFAMEHDLVPR